MDYKWQTQGFRCEIPIPCQKNLHLCTDLFTEIIQSVSYLSYALMRVKSNMLYACLHIMSHNSVVHLGQRARIQRFV